MDESGWLKIWLCVQSLDLSSGLGRIVVTADPPSARECSSKRAGAVKLLLPGVEGMKEESKVGDVAFGFQLRSASRLVRSGRRPGNLPWEAGCLIGWSSCVNKLESRSAPWLQGPSQGFTPVRHS